jgi:uncharacterized protein
MGSRAMTHAPTVQRVLEIVRDRGLFFIDSRTTSSTMGFSLARGMSIPAGERTVFIDSADKADTEYSVGQLREVIARARTQGSCIAIGHPSPETIAAIRRMVEEFRSAGVEFVFASDVVSVAGQ